MSRSSWAGKLTVSLVDAARVFRQVAKRSTVDVSGRDDETDFCMLYQATQEELEDVKAQLHDSSQQLVVAQSDILKHLSVERKLRMDNSEQEATISKLLAKEKHGRKQVWTVNCHEFEAMLEEKDSEIVTLKATLEEANSKLEACALATAVEDRVSSRSHRPRPLKVAPMSR